MPIDTRDLREAKSCPRSGSGSAETRRSFAASPDVEPEPMRDASSTETEVQR